MTDARVVRAVRVEERGVPWPRGIHRQDQTFALTGENGRAVPARSRPLAYWPDGSLKWTAHAVASGTGRLPPTAGAPAVPDRRITVDRRGVTIDMSTGVIAARISRSGSTLIESVTRGSTGITRNGRLVLVRPPEI